jgi:hypothetical protein
MTAQEIQHIFVTLTRDKQASKDYQMGLNYE